MNPNDTNQQGPVSAPPQPISGGTKETEPHIAPESGMEDPVEFSVPKEVSHHMQVTPTRPEIPPDVKQAGVTHAPSDQSMSSTPATNTVKIPLTDDQITDGMSKKPHDSFRWLAEWCIKQLKLAHVHIQKINGRYIRVPDHT